jgi:hypothetical protein
MVKMQMHENDPTVNTSPHCEFSRLRVHRNLSLPHFCYRRQHFNPGQHLWCIKHNISPSSGRFVRPAVAACSAICKLNSGKIPEKSNLHLSPLLSSKVVQHLFGSNLVITESILDFIHCEKNQSNSNMVSRI